MPRVDLYIRKEYWEKWQRIEDKPKWLQMALEGTDVPKVNRAIEERKNIEAVLEKSKVFQALKEKYGDEPHYELTGD